VTDHYCQLILKVSFYSDEYMESKAEISTTIISSYLFIGLLNRSKTGKIVFEKTELYTEG